MQNTHAITSNVKAIVSAVAAHAGCVFDEKTRKHLPVSHIGEYKNEAVALFEGKMHCLNSIQIDEEGLPVLTNQVFGPDIDCRKGDVVGAVNVFNLRAKENKFVEKEYIQTVHRI